MVEAHSGILFDFISLGIRCSQCVKWRQTGECKPDGPRESGNDKPCSAKIDGGSGFCECTDGRRTLKKKCTDDAGISCNEACSKFLPHILIPLQEYSGIISFNITTFDLRYLIGCLVDGKVGDGMKKGSCDEGLFCYSDGVCRGWYKKFVSDSYRV